MKYDQFYINFVKVNNINMKNKKLVLLSTLLIVLLISTEVTAQGFGNLDGISFEDDVNDEPIPIFGHLFLLLSIFVGFFLGYKRLKN